MFSIKKKRKKEDKRQLGTTKCIKISQLMSSSQGRHRGSSRDGDSSRDRDIRRGVEHRKCGR